MTKTPTSPLLSLLFWILLWILYVYFSMLSDLGVRIFFLHPYSDLMNSWYFTWSNRQIWSWSMEWSRSKANRVLPRECTGHSKHPLPTPQEKTLHMDITRWSTLKSYWLYSLQPKMEKLYTVSKNKIGSWLWLGSWTHYCQIQT